MSAHFVGQSFSTACTRRMFFCQNLAQDLVWAQCLHLKWIEAKRQYRLDLVFRYERGLLFGLFHSTKIFSLPAEISSDLFLTFFLCLPFHFSLVCSLSLEGNPWSSPCAWISLICRSFLLYPIFLLLIWAASFADSLIVITVYVTDQKWWEEKNAKKKEAKYLEEVWFGKQFKASYLISHNLPSVTNMFHYNLHLNGVKRRHLSWLLTPLWEHPFLPLSPHATCTETQGEIKTPMPDGSVLTPSLLCRHHC